MDQLALRASPAVISARLDASAISDRQWRSELPPLVSAVVTLRELRLEDAAPLMAHLGSDDVSRFVAPPPTGVDGYERFIAWTHLERRSRQYVCYGVVPAGDQRPVGIFQMRSLESGFATAEWSVVIGSAHWGGGLFGAAARLALDFAFDQIGVQRLEARVAVMNGRGNGALRKVGAVQEGVLRRSFRRNGRCHDQVLWSILAEDWRLQRSASSRHIH